MAASLEPKFSKSEIDMLMESVESWESSGNEEFYIMSMIENTPMPPEDHPAHDYVMSLKNQFKERRSEIENRRKVRKERSVFARAKLLLVLQSLAADKIFDMEENSTNEEIGLSVDTQSSIPESTSNSNHQLQKAEYYISDLGVWDRYQIFLKESRDDFFRSDEFGEFLKKVGRA